MPIGPRHPPGCGDTGTAALPCRLVPASRGPRPEKPEGEAVGPEGAEDLGRFWKGGPGEGSTLWGSLDMEWFAQVCEQERTRR